MKIELSESEVRELICKRIEKFIDIDTSMYQINIAAASYINPGGMTITLTPMATDGAKHV